MLIVIPALLLALPPFAGPTQDADPGRGADALFAPATADMVIPAGDSGDAWTLLDVLQDYSQLTGQHVRMNAATREYLAGQAAGLTRSAAVPRGEVQSFVEGLLVGHDCFLTVERTAEPRLVSAHWLNGYRNPMQVRELALHAEEAELARLSVHPALMVSAAIDAPNVDGRQLVNSMRILLTDSNRQVLVPAGASNTILLAGPAPWVRSIVRLVRAADESSRREAAKATAVFVRLPLVHASAAQVAETVEELMRASTRPGAESDQQGMPRPYADRNRIEARVLADARTNALLAAVLPADVERLRALVALVDVEAE
jgi:hypothetical protein